MYDWQVTEEAGGKIVARLMGTEVSVVPCPDGERSGWCWEVRFADGQTQTGSSPDPDTALEKGKRTAERFLP